MATRTVVVAVDGSAHSKAAFEWYLSNVWRPDDMVVVTHIPEPPNLPTFSFKSPLNIPFEEWQKLLQEAADKVRHIEEEYETTLIHKKIHYKMKGDGKTKPGEGILAVADEVSADLIIMGSRGLDPLRRTFLGSVSDYVIHNTKIPVSICPKSE